MQASGTFEIKVVPQAPDSAPARAAGLMRMSIDKRYHGPLEATGQGEMLAQRSADGGEGAYVAMETVEGLLDGRAGRFVLVHRSLMRGGAPQEWTVSVVPGSGAGALAGIEGQLSIRIEGGQHHYAFDYTLPAA